MIRLLLLFNVAHAWLRYGAKHCINECFNKYEISFYCSHGREMGWCCQDDTKVECRENPGLEIFCNYNQDFNRYLKYFSCIRESQLCGTSSTVFYSISGLNQTIEVSNDNPTNYGGICWYEIRQASDTTGLRVYLTKTNVDLTLAVGSPGKQGNKKHIESYKEITDEKYLEFELNDQSLWILTKP